MNDRYLVFFCSFVVTIISAVIFIVCLNEYIADSAISGSKYDNMVLTSFFTILSVSHLFMISLKEYIIYKKGVSGSKSAVLKGEKL